MKVYNFEKTSIIENPDLTRGYLMDDKLINIIPACAEVQEKSHYVTIRTYENGGCDVEKVIDRPYQPAVPETERIEEIQVYVPYTEEELLERKKQELRHWRKRQFEIIDCAVWYDCLTTEEKEQVKQFRFELLDITETLVFPKVPDCVVARLGDKI